MYVYLVFSRKQHRGFFLLKWIKNKFVSLKIMEIPTVLGVKDKYRFHNHLSSKIANFMQYTYLYWYIFSPLKALNSWEMLGFIANIRQQKSAISLCCSLCIDTLNFALSTISSCDFSFLVKNKCDHYGGWIAFTLPNNKRVLKMSRNAFKVKSDSLLWYVYSMYAKQSKIEKLVRS